eukprot:TRINITY_DN1318_c0_g1_i1.p2 TRINITY_DN1318_c0_g1~~TRINITY_DN1318_c0_g1_i1.p2  ORF type:complete len:150 (-),score=28.56 TRINITY_DN1318_c0_g1_i1:146-595(-)
MLWLLSLFFLFFFFNDAATTEIYTILFVGSVRCVQETAPFTIRAKELMDIYYGLKLRKISIDERLDILLNTKWTVNQYDEELTREIQELIDREADMINRGRSESSLEGLRQRLQNLFLQFIETPNYNPEASRFQKLPIELLMFNATDKN